MSTELRRRPITDEEINKIFAKPYFEPNPIAEVNQAMERISHFQKKGATKITIGYIEKGDFYSFVLRYPFHDDGFAVQFRVTKETTEQYLLGRSDLEGRREELQEFLQIQRQNYIMDLPL